MITIKKAAELSWLSQAAYLGFEGIASGATGVGLADRLQTSAVGADKRFVSEQADKLANASSGYSFIGQQPNTPNGTSLAAFKSNDTIRPITRSSTAISASPSNPAS